VGFGVRQHARPESISKRVPSTTLTADQQLRLWKFDSAKWLVRQTTEMIGLRSWLAVRDDFRNWIVTAV
jgi:hypothetical protein